MDAFSKALAQLDPERLAWLVGLILPLGGAIWAVIHWVYSQKVHTLELAFQKQSSYWNTSAPAGLCDSN
jgi:hypothetical protein